MTISGNVNLNGNNIVGTDYLISGLCSGSTNFSGNYSCSGASQNTNYTVTMTNYETNFCLDNMGNNEVNYSDFTIVQNWILGLPPSPGIDYHVICDINEDGNVTATDLVYIQRFALMQNPWGINQVRFVSQDHIDEVNNCSQCDYLEEWSGETINTGTSSSVTVDFTMYQLGDANKSCQDYYRSSNFEALVTHPYSYKIKSGNQIIISFKKLTYFSSYFKFNFQNNEIIDAHILSSPNSSTAFNDKEIISMGKNVEPIVSGDMEISYLITLKNEISENQFKRIISEAHLELYNPLNRDHIKLIEENQGLSFNVWQDNNRLFLEWEEFFKGKLLFRSLDGKLLKEEEIFGTQHKMDIPYNIKNDIYIITIQDDKTVKSQRVLISN